MSVSVRLLTCTVLLRSNPCHRETRDFSANRRRDWQDKARAEQAAWQDEAEEDEEVGGEADAAVEEVGHSRRALA